MTTPLRAALQKAMEMGIVGSVDPSIRDVGKIPPFVPENSLHLQKSADRQIDRTDGTEQRHAGLGSPAPPNRSRGWGSIPSCTVPHMGEPPRMAEDDANLLFKWACRQPIDPALNWAMDRANRIYGDSQPDWSTRDCHLAAVVDLALYQLSHVSTVDELVQEMRFMEEAHKHCQRHLSCTDERT